MNVENNPFCILKYIAINFHILGTYTIVSSQALKIQLGLFMHMYPHDLGLGLSKFHYN